MKTRAFIAAAAFAVAGFASAAPLKRAFKTEQAFPLDRRGTLVIENPIGNISVEGADLDEVQVVIVKTVSGKSEAAIEEGRSQTLLIVGGDNVTRRLRATIPPARGAWSANVTWNVRLPRTASVRIISQDAQIRVQGIAGHVHVKNFNGSIVLDSNTGPLVAESVNGSMLYRNAKPRANVLLSSVNGTVTASVAPEADIRWVAETVKGQVRTNLPARGAFIGMAFRSTLNAPGGPSITTSTLMGDAQLLALGTGVQTAEVLPRSPSPAVPHSSRVSAPISPIIHESLIYETSLGDVRVQQIGGDADISTGAGEVQLGSVRGACKVESLGGPLQLGEIFGPLTATTRAGDILVDSARRGGSIRTQGGTIQLLYTSGPVDLYSGGGDINVRQAAAPVTAETRSGDISITIDPAAKSQRVNATTARGNVQINMTPKFAADIDAVVLTDDAGADVIQSDFPGLSIRRDQFEGKTRVRATGKINGGGERLVLRATGVIRLSTRGISPTVVSRR